MGLAARGVLAWHQSQPCRELPAILDVRRIAHRRDHGRRRERPNAGNRPEALADWTGLTNGFQLLVVVGEALLECLPLLLELPKHFPAQPVLSVLGPPSVSMAQSVHSSL